MRNKNLIHKLFSSLQGGFTLIELIVAFTVIAILSVVGVASFADYSKSQTILADRQKLISVLNTAKANASSQLKETTDCPTSSNPLLNEALNGYLITIDDDKNYTLYIECINTSSLITNQSQISTYKLSKNIDFDLTANPSTHVVKIFYPLFSGKAVLYSDTIGEGTVLTSPGTITLTGNDKTSTITIDQTGIIR